MFSLDIFGGESVTKLSESMFARDIKANKETLTQEIKGKNLDQNM